MLTGVPLQAMKLSAGLLEGNPAVDGPLGAFFQHLL